MHDADTIFVPMFHMNHSLCVQARELLRWDQLRLSQESGVSLLKLRAYETGAARLRSISQQAIAYAFEKQGLLFFPGEPPMFGANVRGCCPDPRTSPDYYLLE